MNIEKSKVYASAVLLLFTLHSCNPLKKLANQANADMPSDIKGRFYDKHFIGTYITHPEDILGRIIYVYKTNDTTFTYKTSILHYPNKLGTISQMNEPKIKLSGAIEIKNSNDFGLFLSAFNLTATTQNSSAAEIVVVDSREVSIHGDTIQNYFSKKPELPNEKIDGVNPSIIYYVRGVNITTTSAKSATAFSNKSTGTGAFFKLNNEYYQAGTNFSFECRAGLTVDDLTSYILGNNKNKSPQKEKPNLNISDHLGTNRLKKNTKIVLNQIE